MPTALELTREQWKPYIEAARRRSREEHEETESREEQERLLARVRDAAAALKKHLGVERVWLFGSLARGDWFMPDSDVDLAVSGLPEGLFFQAWKLAEDIVSERLVDLIEVERAPASLRAAIERYGIEL